MEISIRKLREVLADVSALPEKDVLEMSDKDLLDASFANLGLDSLDYVNLLNKLEISQYLASESELWECRTVEELFHKIKLL